MNRQLFKYYQSLNGDSGSSTAKVLRITPQTLSSRLTGKRGDFTSAEIALLKERWHLTDEQCADIFFREVPLKTEMGKNKSR